MNVSEYGQAIDTAFDLFLRRINPFRPSDADSRRYEAKKREALEEFQAAIQPAWLEFKSKLAPELHRHVQSEGRFRRYMNGAWTMYERDVLMAREEADFGEQATEQVAAIC